jgi:aspartate aminotransferase-like enzyme
MLDFGEDRGVQVLGKETEDGARAVGNGVELLHHVVDNFCEDVTVRWRRHGRDVVLVGYGSFGEGWGGWLGEFAAKVKCGKLD